jgi:hypothetical protein
MYFLIVNGESIFINKAILIWIEPPKEKLR